MSEIIRKLCLWIPPVVLVKDRVFDVQAVKGSSMAPTLQAGDWLLVWKMISEKPDFPTCQVLPNSLVVFASPISDKWQRLVKRVVSVRNGQSGTRNFFTVAGDNKESSVDSRVFGEINDGLVEGVVIGVCFPPWRMRSFI